MFWGKLFLLLVFIFSTACTYYVDETLEIGEITLVEVVAHNQRLKLVASVKNAAKGTVYAWSATCGSFDDPSSPAPIYIAPEKSGYCVLTLKVSKGGKSTIKSDYIAIETPVSGYPVMAKIDGLSTAPIANISADSAVFAADQGDGYRLYKLTALGGNVITDSVPSLPIEDGVHLLAANSGGKIAVLTGGEAPRKVLLYEGAALSKTPTLLGIYPADSETSSFSPLGEAAFALTDDYLVIGSRNENAETFIEIYSLSGAAAHIKSPEEIGGLSSIAAQKVSGTTFLLLGGSAGTKAYAIDSLSITPLDSTLADGKASLQIKWNGSYALESKLNNAEVAVWKWGSSSPQYAGSVYAPNGEDKSPVRAFQLDADNKAAVVSFNGGNVYEVDLTADISGTVLPKKLIFTYPMHIGEGFSVWAVERAEYGGDVYYVLTGSYYSTLGDTAPGTSLIFKATPNIALGAVPEAAIYFGGVVDMLKTITDGEKYFYIAKDIGAKKFVVKEIK
jgi:hypothetical protein